MHTLVPPQTATQRWRRLLSWTLVPVFAGSAALTLWLLHSSGLETQRYAAYLATAILWPVSVLASTFLYYPRDKDVAVHRAGELLIGFAALAPILHTVMAWRGNVFGGVTIGGSLVAGFVLGMVLIFKTSHLIEDTYAGGWAP